MPYYKAEKNIAEKLIQLDEYKNIKQIDRFEKELDVFEKKSNIELSEEQLSKRIKQTGYQLLDGQFFYLVKNTENKLDIKDDLLLELKEFSEKYNGSLVIIDMMAGISYGSSYDLNSYMLDLLF